MQASSNMAFAKKGSNNISDNNTIVKNKQLMNHLKTRSLKVGSTHPNKIVRTGVINLRNLPITHMLFPNDFPTMVGRTVDTSQAKAQLVNPSTPIEGMFESSPGSENPDVSVAAGPNHLIQMTQFHGEILTKDGKIVSGPFDLKDLFTNVGPAGRPIIEKPKVMYDGSSSSIDPRWYAIAIDHDSSSMRLIVSNTSDPLEGFVSYMLPFDSSCMDYPTLGYSSDKIAISVNLYNTFGELGCDYSNNGFQGVQYYIIDKEPLINGRELDPTEFFKSDIDNSKFSLYAIPSVNNADTTLYMATLNNCKDPTGHPIIFPNGRCNNVQILYFDNIGKPTQIQNVTIRPTVMPPHADQPDTNVLIDTGDNRIRSAFRNFASTHNDIVFAFNDGCGSKACFTLVQINLGTLADPITKVFQDFTIGANNGNYFYPALTSNVDGNIGITFGASSSGKICLFVCITTPFLKIYPSLMAGQAGLSSESQCFFIFSHTPFCPFRPNQFTSLGIIGKGTIPDVGSVVTLPDGRKVADYGEYFGAGEFPGENGDEIWLSGAYYKNDVTRDESTWHTKIFELR